MASKSSNDSDTSREPDAKRAKIDHEDAEFVFSDDDDGNDFDKQFNDIDCQLEYLQSYIEKEVALNATQTKYFIGQMEELRMKLTKLEKEFQEKNITMSKMQKEIDNLKKLVNDYERDRNKLYLSQVAVEFEHAVCTHVLPEVFENDNFATIRRLLRYINGGDRLPFLPKSCKDENDVEEMLQRACKQWKDLCDHLKLPEEWKTETGGRKFDFYDSSLPDIFRAIQLLKDKRNSVAHPTPVSMKKAVEILSKSQWMQKDLTGWQLQLVQAFIPSLSRMIKDCDIHIDPDKLEN